MTDDKDSPEMAIGLSTALALLASARGDLEYEILLTRLDDHERRITELEKKNG
jgi:hypothetical protein